MSVLRRQLEVAGSRSRRKVEVIFDSGASQSCIEESLARRLGMIYPLPTALRLKTAKKGQVLQITRWIGLEMRLNGFRLQDSFAVVQDLPVPVLIGASTLQKFHMALDFKKHRVRVDPSYREGWLL